MAFPATNYFRNTFIAGLTLPIASGAAGSTVELASTKLRVTVYKDAITGTNFDTDKGYNTTAWGTTNEVAASGTYVQGAVTAGTLSATTTFVQATPSAGGTAIILGPTNINVSWTTVSWAAGATAGQGCLVWNLNATSTDKWGVAAFLFGTALSPTAGTVTITWTNGILSVN
jgi:hypothetical protein